MLEDSQAPEPTLTDITAAQGAADQPTYYSTVLAPAPVDIWPWIFAAIILVALVKWKP